MKLSACGKSDVGLVRDNNEDSYFVSEPDGLFLIADGMGGHVAGEIASEMAVRQVCDRVIPQLGKMKSNGDIGCTLADAAHAANTFIVQATARNPSWQGMGTTLTILLVQSDVAYLTHVGDSRLYRFRSGQLTQLSEDHTLVEDQLRRGLITAAEAKSSNMRNILLQAVGIAPDLEIFQKQFSFAENDLFLLCSDGLTDMLTDKKIAAYCESETDITQLCDQLVAGAKDAGGKDNITVVLVRVDRR